MLSNTRSWENSYVSSITSSWYFLFCLLCLWLFLCWVLGFWYLHSLSNIITSFLPDNKLLAYVWAAWPPLLKHKLPTCQWGEFFSSTKYELTAVSPREAFQMLFKLKQLLCLSLCFIILESLLPVSYHIKMCLSVRISALHRHPF